jgi:putative flippase GtrA
VFTGVGAIGTALHFLVLVALVDALGADPVISSALGFLVGAVANYLLNYKVTFRSGKSHSEAAAKFAIVAAIGLGLNTSVMAVFVGWMHLHYLVSQVLATGLVLLWNFTANRQWTFLDKSGGGL